MIESRAILYTVDSIRHIPSSQKQQKWANRGDGIQHSPSSIILTVYRIACIYISTIHSLKQTFNHSNKEIQREKTRQNRQEMA